LVLIDSSYFFGELDIPNIRERQNTIDSNIEKYEKEFLICLLGQALFKEFQTALDAGPLVEQRWIDLKDGADFTLDFFGTQVPLKWNGLVNTEKVSPIAYYVYYKIRLEDLTTTMGSAEVVAKHENSVAANARRKMVNSWSKMLDLYGSIRFNEFAHDFHFLNTSFNNLSFGFTFDKYADIYDTFNDLPTAFNFLNVNRANYSGWVFRPYIEINEFGI